MLLFRATQVVVQAEGACFPGFRIRDPRKDRGPAPGDWLAFLGALCVPKTMYGRRPRCKGKELTLSEAFGCSHVSGL